MTQFYEDKSDEWLNKSKYRYAVYYPDGTIVKFEEGSIFRNEPLGNTVYSDFVGAVVIVEKTEDNKKIWLEKAQ